MSKHDDELFAFEYLQAVLGVSFLQFSHDDKPDFVVTHSGYKTGIEFTSGSSEEFQRALVLARANQLPSFDSSQLSERPMDFRRSNAEILDEISIGEFVCAEDYAVHWAERIVKRIRTKSELIQRGEIRRFEKNWLVILNGQSDDSGLDSDFYRAVLLGALGSDKGPRLSFDVIYVISSRRVFVIDKDRIRCEPLDAEVIASRMRSI